MLATYRHHFLSERCVAYVRDDGGEDATSALDQPGWGRVELALLCRRTIQDGADLDGRRRLKDHEWHGNDTIDDRWRRGVWKRGILGNRLTRAEARKNDVKG